MSEGDQVAQLMAQVSQLQLEQAKQLQSMRTQYEKELAKLKKQHEKELAKTKAEMYKTIGEQMGAVRESRLAQQGKGGKEAEREKRRKPEVKEGGSEGRRGGEEEEGEEETATTSWPLRYFDEFFTMRCNADLLDSKVFSVTSPAKEFTEAMACFNAIRTHLVASGPGPEGDRPFDLRDPSTTALVIGDGSTPRAGALIAMRTSWECISVDPAFKTKAKVSPEGVVSYPWQDIGRLTVLSQPIQEVRIRPTRLVVVMMHCHVDLEEALLCVDSRCELVGIVACPCCNFVERQRTFMGKEPRVTYRDQHMATPQNTMRIWVERDLEPAELRDRVEKRQRDDGRESG